jgi:ribosomal protein L21E
MQEFEVEDRVRIDIPDETDPDHAVYHGQHGEVVSVLADDAAVETGDSGDAKLYRVEFDSGDKADFRLRDLRPPLDGSSHS